MIYQDLNKYILHYLTEDKTKSAIMLTAPWGTGKSFYIQNELKPFLKLKENGSHDCVVVSLYGLNDLAEISKSIYLDLRTGVIRNWWNKNIFSHFPKKAQKITKEIMSAGKSVGSTIFKGLTVKIGIDFDISDKDLKKLYNSIDLAGKLIILEDLERSGIDILEVLGYVNNLVEQDGVKVLLVANEEEIIKFEFNNRIIGQSEKQKIEVGQFLHKSASLSTENKNEIIQCQSSEDYLRMKEKTVSDTIRFEEDYQTAIRDIINLYGNDILKKFSNEEVIKKILSVMSSCNTFNLRSFIYATQKASDIFEKLEDKYCSDDNFIQAIYFGILFFVLRQKTGKTGKWKQEKYFSVELGDEKAPLFKFCYDYIVNHNTDFSMLEKTFYEYRNFILYNADKSNGDDDIRILQTYYVQSEKKIKRALYNIETRLGKTPDDISFYQYGTIAVYIITIEELFGYNVEPIKKLLIENLSGRGTRLEIEQIFRIFMGNDCSPNGRKKYEDLRKKMADSLKIGNCIITNFDYRADQSKVFYDYAVENYEKFQSQNSFLSGFDVAKIGEMFKKGTAEQKQTIREAFSHIYHSPNISNLLGNDREDVSQLLEIVKKDSKDNVGDKVQKLQYDWFIKNLEVIKGNFS